MAGEGQGGEEGEPGPGRRVGELPVTDREAVPLRPE